MNVVKSIFAIVLMWVATVAFAWVPLLKMPVPVSCRDFATGWTIYGAAIAPLVVTVVTPILAIAYVRSNDRVGEFVLMIFSLYAFAITGYALAFYTTGIEDTARSGEAITSFWDYLYFSAVTFTTLGYGDFRPCEPGRVYAAIEAIFGGFFLPFSSAVLFLSKYLRAEKDRGEGSTIQSRKTS